MGIINQQWFWNSIVPVIALIIGSLLTMLVNYWKEKSNRTTQIKIEKLKIYDEKKFQAYLDLYEFISKAYFSYYPPDNPRQDFISLMKNYFFKKVKIHYPYLKSEVRENIKILENQYLCLGEPDFIPQIPFDQFFRTEYLKILNKLNKATENLFDNWENN